MFILIYSLYEQWNFLKVAVVTDHSWKCKHKIKRIKMFFTIFLLLIFGAIFWYKNKTARHNFLLSKIPSPKIYPILYHNPHFFNKNPSTFFYYIEELNKNLGDVYYICLGNVFDAFGIVSDVKIVEELLTSNIEFDKTPDYQLLVAWIGTGLLISSDRKWFQRRKV